MITRLVALYDDIETAQEAIGALIDAGFSPENIDMVARDVTGQYAERYDRERTEAEVGPGEGAGFGAIVGALIGVGFALVPGIGIVAAAGPVGAAIAGGTVGAAAGAATGGITAALVDLGVDADEVEYYAETLRRGGALVSIVVSDDTIDHARTILEDHHPDDIDRRAEYYEANGWQGHDERAQPYDAAQVAEDRDRYYAFSGRARPQRTAPPATSASQDTIDVVQEELAVGKREVAGNRVRVRTTLIEEPVEEHIQLREERVKVERRPVDRAATEADFRAFEEGEIELTERREEPVISKQARVVEEVVIRKDVDYHDETVRDTVRRTQVDVEGAEGVDRAPEYEPFERYTGEYERHYRDHFAQSGYTYQQYEPAYRYGYNLATSPYTSHHGWEQVATEARTRWEEHNEGTWEQFKDAVRQGWNSVKGAVS